MTLMKSSSGSMRASSMFAISGARAEAAMVSS